MGIYRQVLRCSYLKSSIRARTGQTIFLRDPTGFFAKAGSLFAFFCSCIVYMKDIFICHGQHRMRSHDLLCSYISFLSRIGLGKFRVHNKRTGISRSEFSAKHADYIYFLTNYSSEREMLTMARTSKFRASHRFNIEFYFIKLRQLRRVPYKARYKLARSALLDSIAIKFLRYLSSATLVCEKRNTYE